MSLIANILHYKYIFEIAICLFAGLYILYVWAYSDEIKEHYKTNLTIAFYILLFGNIMGFVLLFTYKINTFFGALNGPLIDLGLFKFISESFENKYGRSINVFAKKWPPPSPYEIDGSYMTIHGILCIIITVFFASLTHGTWWLGSLGINP